MNERQAPAQPAAEGERFAETLARMSLLAKRIYRELAEAVESQRAREQAD